ncbi:hypothetical protein SDC9_90903 [bioreactor metagenome]|uniref:Uncharacterized protein n=1 Tax=bioreactor metagenome TaxID=1076179 RepID=A0A644ZTL0_9ZZZZ
MGHVQIFSTNAFGIVADKEQHISGAVQCRVSHAVCFAAQRRGCNSGCIVSSQINPATVNPAYFSFAVGLVATHKQHLISLRIQCCGSFIEFSVHIVRKFCDVYPFLHGRIVLCLIDVAESLAVVIENSCGIAACAG